MTLSEGQVSVGSLTMGPGTVYKVTLSGTDLWSRSARAGQQNPRAWNHGAWSGAEFQNEAVVPMRIAIQATNAATWLAALRALTAAFAPTSQDVELRFTLGGTEYVLFGRPRVVEVDLDTAANIRVGTTIVRCGFVALDPLTYSGTQHSEALVLPTTSGGLEAPVTAPVTVSATVVSGRATVSNAGTAPVGLTLRIDGPVAEPRVSMLFGSTSQVLRFAITLTSGQWLDVDTAARTVYLNGTASRRGQTYGDWPVLNAGSSELAFDAASYNASAHMSASWRDAWY